MGKIRAIIAAAALTFAVAAPAVISSSPVEAYYLGCNSYLNGNGGKSNCLGGDMEHRVKITCVGFNTVVKYGLWTPTVQGWNSYATCPSGTSIVSHQHYVRWP